MIARLASGLKQPPREIRRMRRGDAFALLDYWRNYPPEAEMLAMLARVYTTWKPDSARAKNEDEARAQHRASLQARWNAGAFGPEQLYKIMKGQTGPIGPAMFGVPGGT